MTLEKKMSFNEDVKKLEREIKGKNRIRFVYHYEKKLSKNIEELSKNENFFNLPLKYI